MGRCEFDPADVWDNDTVALVSRIAAGTVRRIQFIDTTALPTGGVEFGLGPPGTLHDVAKTEITWANMWIGNNTHLQRVRIVSGTSIGFTSGVGDGATTAYVQCCIVEYW